MYASESQNQGSIAKEVSIANAEDASIILKWIAIIIAVVGIIAALYLWGKIAVVTVDANSIVRSTATDGGITLLSRNTQLQVSGLPYYIEQVGKLNSSADKIEYVFTNPVGIVIVIVLLLGSFFSGAVLFALTRIIDNQIMTLRQTDRPLQSESNPSG